MLAAGRRQRHGRISLWWPALCFALLGLLGVVVSRARIPAVSDPELVAELGQAEPVEEAGPSGDWPQWLGPRRDGVSAGADLLTEWPEKGPPVLWRVKGGGGYSALAVADGRACTLVQDGDDEAVVCWDADTGRELWRFPYPASYANGNGPGPRSTPALDGGRVYTVGGTGLLHCLDAATGKKLWAHDLLAEFHAPNLQWGVCFSPLVEDGLVFTNPGGPGGNSLAAFDKQDGRLVWKAQGDPAGYSSPIAVTAAGTRQVIFFTGAGLVSVTPRDGELLWRYPWETSFGVNAATPLFFRARSGDRTLDYLFISSDYGKGCAVLEVLPGEDGRPEVRTVYANDRMRNHFATGVRRGSHVFGLDEPGALTCMDLATGRVTWHQPRFGKGSLIAAGGHLLVLTETGELVLADAAPDAYHERARCAVFDGRCWTVPALARGRLYLRDESDVVCLDLRKH